MDLEYANEDTVQCYFFTSTSNDNVEFLEEQRDNVNKTIKTISLDYIWHKDEFKVHLPFDDKSKEDTTLPPHLISLTCFGDNIEDEWFIVYLILEISKQHKNLVVQVKDNDGDFLLIEAADYLPPWANPDNTENRVFVYNGHIHLIPLSVANKEVELDLKSSIQFVSDPKIKTEEPAIQEAILKRISNYPGKIKENVHRSIVKLPLDIATLLTLEPSLISPIVSTYSHHDMIDAKVCKNIKFVNCVTVEVKFTRCLYAMLIHSKLIKNNKYAILNENEKKCSLGIKLTCGYEMIMGKLSEDIFTSKAYNKFHTSLVNNGYFKENIEGSKNYKQLLENAKDFFLRMEAPINSQVCHKISHLMCSKEFIELKALLQDKPVPESELTDDNEDWLNIHPEQLNELLNSRYGKHSSLKKDDIITAQTITSQLSSFLKQSSDFEGIERNEQEDLEDNNIEFDSEEFVNSLKNMLNIITSGDVDLHSDDSDDSEEEEEDDALDKEIKSKLHTDSNAQNSKTILFNMLQSMKEEEGSSGPSSNILRTIGINKTDLLDSDDDEI